MKGGTVVDQPDKRSSTWLAAGLVYLLAATGCAMEEYETPPPLSVSEMVPILDQPQEPFDVMPEDLQVTPEADPQSVRYVGSGGGTEYWVAARKDMQGVCFYISETGVNDSLVGGCIGARSFYDNGLINSSGDRSGHLISSDVDTSILTRHLADRLVVIEAPKAMSSERASSQAMTRLVAFDVDRSSSASLRLPRTSGEPVVFNT